ncbi:MAG: hypothetical protein L3K17_04715 [Thermoplasmata archaeon]|nr:hypothetical protein [Thermoplasmata archaeon]
MASVTPAELQAFASQRAGASHDAYSEAALLRALDEFQASRRPPVAAAQLTVDGTSYPTFYAALDDPQATFARTELALIAPPPPGPAWDWLIPFSRVVFASDGSAEVFPLDGGEPQRRIARVLRRETYVPRDVASVERSRSRSAPAPRVGLLELAPSAAAVRAAGIVPFGVAILLYGADTRLRLELDLVAGALSPDPRAGRMVVSRRVRRTSRVAHEVDKFLGRGELSVGNARVLEVLVESHGLTPFEVTQIFGGVRESGASALRTLAARGLATLDRQTGVYRPRFEAFRPKSGGPERFAPLPNPALRTSVMELLAAADSRATCPLCGDPLPAGPRGILCARCQIEVGSAEEAPR